MNESGRLGLFFRAFDHPLLGLAQILTAKKKAVVFCFLLPFLCTGQETSMCLYPRQVGIKSRDQCCKLCIELIAVSTIYSLNLPRVSGIASSGTGR